jgi:hypothetical protein
LEIDNMDFTDEMSWQDAMRREEQQFAINKDAIMSAMDDIEDEIAMLEGQKRSLLEARDGMVVSKPAPLLDGTAAIANAYLAKLRAARHNNAAMAAAEHNGTTAVRESDGKPLKKMKDPELKLLHRLTIELKPSPLTPIAATPPEPSSAATTPGSSPSPAPQQPEGKKKSGFGGLFSSIKEKLKEEFKSEDDKTKALAATLDPETQAMCRLAVSLERLPGQRHVADQSEPVEVASVSFTLRSAPPPGHPALRPDDAGELAAYVNMTIHNAIAAAAGMAQDSGVLEELKKTNVMQHHEVAKLAGSVTDEQRAAAKRILESMLIDVEAEAIDGSDEGGATAFAMTVIIRQRQASDMEATIAKILASEDYRRHKEAAEKAYAVIEMFAAQSFNATFDVGIAARPPDESSCTVEEVQRRKAAAMAKVKASWGLHKELLKTDTIASVVEDAASEQRAKWQATGLTKEEVAKLKLQELVDMIRPPVTSVIDTCVLPAVHRSVCAPTADTEPLAKAPVACNLYSVTVRRAPREAVKLVVNEVYDAAARTAATMQVGAGGAREGGTKSPPPPGDAKPSKGGAGVRLAAAKAQVSAALTLYDDLHLDVVPFPHKSAKDRKRAAILLQRAESGTANAVGAAAERLVRFVHELMAERQAVAAVEEAEGKMHSALKDASSVVAAVVRAVNTLTGPAGRGHRQLSRATHKYDVTLCACESKGALTARVVIKPPPSVEDGVEASRLSLALGLHPANALARCYTGRTKGQPCRCDVFNAPLQLLLADIASRTCDVIDARSPFRLRSAE